MTIRLGYCYSDLDKMHEFYLDCGVPSVYTQWIFFGIGQIITDKKGINIYPYYPTWKSIKKIKEYEANSGKSYTWYGQRIGKIILKKLLQVNKKGIK